MNDRSIQSYLSDSNCFFFEQERQSAQEIALKQRQLTQREVMSQQMVKQIDLLTDQIQLLEEEVKDLTNFLLNKIDSARKCIKSQNQSSKEHIQTPKFIEMQSQKKNHRESRSQFDDSSIQQALNSDSEFPNGRIKILFQNMAELKSNLQKCSKEYNLNENEHSSNKIQHQGIQKSLDRLNERLGLLQQDRGETAQRIEDLQLAISRSPISSSSSLIFQQSQSTLNNIATVNLNGGKSIQSQNNSIQTPQPFLSALKTQTPGKINKNAKPVQTFSKPIVDCLLHLIQQMNKMREKISLLLHQLPISQQTGYVQTPRTKQLIDAETLLRPLKAPNTTMTITTVLTIQSAISHLAEMVIDCNISVSGALQQNNSQMSSSHRRYEFTPPNPKFLPATAINSRNINNVIEQKTQRAYNHKPVGSKSPIIQQKQKNTSREKMVNTSRRQNLPKLGNSRYSSNQSNQRIGTKRYQNQPAIKIKQNFMSSSSSSASYKKNYRSRSNSALRCSTNQSQNRLGTEQIEQTRQSRDLQRIQSMLNQVKTQDKMDTSMMSEIQQQVARVLGQNHSTNAFKSEKANYKLSKMKEYVQKVERELNIAYEEIQTLQKQKSDLSAMKNMTPSKIVLANKDKMENDIDNLQMRLAFLQQQVADAQQRRSKLNAEIAQIRINSKAIPQRSGKSSQQTASIQIDDKGCLIKYLKESYSTIMQIKARKKVEKDNMKQKNFCGLTTASMIRQHQTTRHNSRSPSPHSRSNSDIGRRSHYHQNFNASKMNRSSTSGRQTPSRKHSRSNSRTPGKSSNLLQLSANQQEGTDEDAFLVRISKEIRNYIVRLQRDFGKIYKVKQNKDKLVQYFQKQAMELSKSWTMLEDKKRDIQQRDFKVKQREEMISDILSKAGGRGARSHTRSQKNSLLPNQLLRMIQKGTPVTRPGSIQTNKRQNRNNDHERIRSLDGNSRRSYLQSRSQNSFSGSNIVTAVTSPPPPKQAIEVSCNKSTSDVLLKNMQTQISFYKSQISKFKLSIERYRKEKQELENQIIKKQQSNNEQDRRRREIAHELKTTQQIVTQLQREKQQINDVLEKTRNQVSVLKRQKLNLDDVVDTLRDKQSRIQSKVAFQQASLQQEFQSLDSRVAQRQQRLLAMQVGIQRIQQEKISGQADIKQMSARLEVMNKSLANREKQKQEHDILRTRLNQMRDQASNLSNSIVEKEKSVRQLQRMHHELESQKNEVNLNISQIQESKEKQESQLKHYEGKIKQKRIQYEEIKSQVDEAKERALQINQKARSAELKLLQIQQESKAKQQNFDCYKKQLSNFLQQINQIRSQFDGQKRKLEDQIQQRQEELNKLDVAIQSRAHERMNLTNQLQHINDAKQETFQSFEEANKRQQELQLQMADKLLGLKEKVKKAEGRLEEVKGILSHQQSAVEQRREELQYLSQKKDQIIHQIEKQNESLNQIKRIQGEVARSVNKLEERKNVVNIQLAMYGERPDIQMQERITKITQSAMEAETLRKQLQEVEQEKLQMSSKLEHYQQVLSDLKSNSNYLESGFKHPQIHQQQRSNSSYNSLGIVAPVNTNISSPPPQKIGGNFQYHNPSGVSFLSGIDSARSNKSTYRISKTSRQLANLLKQTEEDQNRIILSTKRDGSQTARASLSSSRKREQHQISRTKLSSSKSMGKIKIPRLNLGLKKEIQQDELEKIQEDYEYTNSQLKPNKSMQNRKQLMKHSNNTLNQTLQYKIQQSLVNSFLSPTQNICQSARERKYSSNKRTNNNVIKPSTSAMLMKPIDDMIHRLDAAKQRVQKLSTRRNLNMARKKKYALEQQIDSNNSNININKASFSSGRKLKNNKKSRNYENEAQDDYLGLTQTKQPKQEFKSSGANNNSTSSLSLLINNLHNQQKNKPNAYRRFAATNQENLPSTTIDGTSMSVFLNNISRKQSNVQKKPKNNEKNDQIIKEYLMYAGSDSNLTMEMGGESIISNGLALSPKSLSISTPGRTTSQFDKINQQLNSGKLRSPIANSSKFINLKDGGDELAVVSPKGSGTPKTLR